MCLCVSKALGPPTNLEGERVGSTGILLSWTPPSTSNGQILSYAIKYKEVCPYPESTFTQTLTNSEIPEFLLNTLTPGSTYNIKVRRNGKDGDFLLNLKLTQFVSCNFPIILPAAYPMYPKLF